MVKRPLLQGARKTNRNRKVRVAKSPTYQISIGECDCIKPQPFCLALLIINKFGVFKEGDAIKIEVLRRYQRGSAA